MQKERKAKNFLPKLVYKGGPRAMSKFIANHLQYPKEALDKKVEGTVRIKLDIDYKGKVKEGHIMSGLGHGCDEEALRVVKLLQWELDKPIRKGKFLFHKTVNIRFKLPVKKEQPKSSTKVSYQIVKAPSKKKEQPKKSYSYTIKY